jgi:hypothetical protein
MLLYFKNYENSARRTDEKIRNTCHRSIKKTGNISYFIMLKMSHTKNSYHLLSKSFQQKLN